MTDGSHNERRGSDGEGWRSSHNEQLLAANRLLKWGLGGTAGLLATVLITVIAWYGSSLTALQIRVGNLEAHLGADEAETITYRASEAHAYVTRDQHEALEALVYGVQSKQGVDEVQIGINAKRLDVIEEELRRAIDGDFKKPPKDGP